MPYPSALPLKILQAEHPCYSAAKPAMNRIEILLKGGYELKAQARKFLPQRPGEEADIYADRIKKFTYNNILKDAIRRQVVRFSNGSVELTGHSGASEQFWQAFRENTNGRGRNEMALASEVFSTGLKSRTLYLHIDKPAAIVAPRNRAEEEAMGLYPYINIYQASDVINWGDADERLSWIKVRQIEPDSSNPLSDKVLLKAAWMFIDGLEIATYISYVELDKDGNIINLLDSSGKIKGANSEATVPLVSEPIAHGLGEIPVVRFQLPDELYTTDEAAIKAEEHLRLDCHKFDLLSYAHFQRFYTPVPKQPDSPIETYTEDDAPQIGLQYVNKLANFGFAEPTGAIMPHIFESLDRTELQVKSMIAQQGASAQADVLEQSGVSKELDFVMSNEMLKSYGHLVCEALQAAYRIVDRMMGRNDQLSVSGLDTFDTDSVGKIIERLQGLQQIDLASLRDTLPPTLFSLLLSRLMTLLVNNISAAERDAIEQEILQTQGQQLKPQSRPGFSLA